MEGRLQWRSWGETVIERNIGILGLGKYIPSVQLTNESVEKSAGLEPGTIQQKTGVESRFIVGPDETASGMSTIAAKQALERSGVAGADLNMIIGCTFSADYLTPAMACKVHQNLGAKRAVAFDLMANCTAFQVGLSVASDRMKVDGAIQHSLVLGTAIQSRFVNWSDPDSALYFGDGAGAAVLGPVPDGYGVLANDSYTNSQVYESVRIRGGGSTFPMRAENVNDGLQYYQINGMEVWKQVVQNQPTVIKSALAKIGKEVSDVDFFIFHQANLKLIEFLMGKMKQPMSKTHTNVAQIGNTAEASMVIALCEAVEQGKIERGDLVVISGVGAGFTFGASVMKWY